MYGNVCSSKNKILNYEGSGRHVSGFGPGVQGVPPLKPENLPDSVHDFSREAQIYNSENKITK